MIEWVIVMKRRTIMNKAMMTKGPKMLKMAWMKDRMTIASITDNQGLAKAPTSFRHLCLCQRRLIQTIKVDQNGQRETLDIQITAWLGH